MLTDSTMRSLSYPRHPRPAFSPKALWASCWEEFPESLSEKQPTLCTNLFSFRWKSRSDRADASDKCGGPSFPDWKFGYSLAFSHWLMSFATYGLKLRCFGDLLCPKAPSSSWWVCCIPFSCVWAYWLSLCWRTVLGTSLLLHKSWSLPHRLLILRRNGWATTLPLWNCSCSRFWWRLVTAAALWIPPALRSFPLRTLLQWESIITFPGRALRIVSSFKSPTRGCVPGIRDKDGVWLWGTLSFLAFPFGNFAKRYSNCIKHSHWSSYLPLHRLHLSSLRNSWRWLHCLSPRNRKS